MRPLPELVERVLELVPDGVAAQVVAGRADHGLTRFANSVIHQHVGEDVTALSLQVAVDGRVASAETTRLDDRGVSDLVDNAVTIAGMRPVDPHWPELTGPVEVDADGHNDPAVRAADPGARATGAAAFIAAGGGLSAAGFLDTQWQDVAYGNTTGHRVAGGSTRATVDGIQQTDTSAGKGHATSWRYDDLDPGGVGTRAAQLARDSTGARDLEPGRYEVVLAPECVASLVTFLVGYGFNAKAVLDGESFVVVGEQQFDRAVTLLDDASDERAIGIRFDVEGTPKRPLTLIEAGRSAALAHDRRTALRMDTETTGHAISGGEVWGAFPSDLFLRPGDASPDDLVAEVDRGLLVTEFNYCRILDPKTQVVTGLTRNGTFLIERGEIVRPVTNLRFTQSFVDALAPGAVLGVGDDARFGDAEFGIGVVHCPSLRLAEFTFTGGAQG